MESRSVFLIRRDDGMESLGLYYSAHGPICGVEDAVGYGRLKDAKKFLSCEEAQWYIDHDLPEWARKLHYPVEIHSWDMTFEVPELAVLLRHCESDIPAHLLEPPQDCMLIWRR